MNRVRLLTYFVVLATTAAGLAAGQWLLGGRKPPGPLDRSHLADTLTHSRMSATKSLVQKFAETEGKMPADLSGLFASATAPEGVSEDGWGQPIRYSLDGMTATLSSLGRDGQRGGNGYDRDVFLSFNQFGSDHQESFSYSPSTADAEE